jgi:hypothetical protein
MEPQPQSSDADDKYERELERLIERLPRRLIGPINWLRRPTSRWARIPAGILFIFGGILSFLPILGIWMLPLGLALLAEDLPPLRKMRNRILDRLAKRRSDSLQSERDQSSAPDKNGSGDISE